MKVMYCNLITIKIHVKLTILQKKKKKSYMCMVVTTISEKHLLDLDVKNLFSFAKVVCVALNVSFWQQKFLSVRAESHLIHFHHTCEAEWSQL